MDFEEINFSYLYQAALNGGKPVSDFDEVKAWAERILKVSEDENE